MVIRARIRSLLVLLLLLLLVPVLASFSAGCPKGQVVKDRRGQVDGTAFEFSSAGEELTDEHGAWTVRVRGDALWIAWFKQGKTREYGPFKLTAKETRKLWGLIEDAEITERRGGAYAIEVPTYSFTLLRPKKLSYTVTLKVKQARRDEELDALVDYLARLIKKYAKKKPILE